MPANSRWNLIQGFKGYFTNSGIHIGRCSAAECLYFTNVNKSTFMALRYGRQGCGVTSRLMLAPLPITLKPSCSRAPFLLLI